MTTIKTSINGLPFEITIPDSATLEFSDGAIKIALCGAKTSPYGFHDHYEQGYPDLLTSGNISISPYNSWANQLLATK